ncbi:hypothetical protein HOY34_01805 [Xinfangfangia sp. D13-10-4-6]|uniref:phage holin family protein n=1 Tax=Pseudogemmobacter hezensis TaxID=2737662 RepID=UPI001553D23B|nr:phage holin family protein [Pseudogemmobacter hezensis]NPD13933.1 hypothetical protein [Pseudogemmobacter hezensis]
MSLTALIAQVAQGGLRLLSGEIERRKAEASLQLSIVIRGIVALLAALVLVLLGLGQLTDAAHAGLVLAGLTPLIASLVTGLTLSALAAALLWWGSRQIRRSAFLAREAWYLGHRPERRPDEGDEE